MKSLREEGRMIQFHSSLTFALDGGGGDHTPDHSPAIPRHDED